MRKFFRENYWELFFEDSSFTNKIFGVLVGLMVLFLIVLMLYIGFNVIDKQSKTVYQDNGAVYARQFFPEHNVVGVISTGKITAPIFYHCDDSWYLYIKSSEGCSSACVGEDFYKNTNISDSVVIQYTKGVFTSKIYVKYIDKLKKP